jgi:hypothetical protein
MLRRPAAILIVLSVLTPHLYAEEASGPIATSLTKIQFDFRRSAERLPMPPIELNEHREHLATANLLKKRARPSDDDKRPDDLVVECGRCHRRLRGATTLACLTP